MDRNKDNLASSENMETNTAHAPQTIITGGNALPKTPWRLRFAGLAWKQMVATTVIGTIYGLLFASLLLAPLPRLEAQCAEFDPNDCANPCYVPTSDYYHEEFDDANSQDDCDRILREKLAAIEAEWKKRKEVWEAAQVCDKEYKETLKTNDLKHKAATAAAINTGKGIFWSCLGIGGGIATGSATVIITRNGDNSLRALSPAR